MLPLEFEAHLGTLPAKTTSTATPVAMCDALESAFAAPFALLEAESGEVVHRGPGLPAVDFTVHWAACREVARRGRPEIVEELGPLWLLAVPLGEGAEASHVAVAPLVSRTVSPSETFDSALGGAGSLGADIRDWVLRQTPWPPAAGLRMAEVALDRLRASRRIAHLEGEVRQLSGNINATYEEISLLHRLTQNLKLSLSDVDLGRLALEWLDGVVPAEGMAVCLSAAGRSDAMGTADEPSFAFLTHGRCPIGAEELSRLAEDRWERSALAGQPLVLNRGETRSADWPCPDIREAIFVPLSEGKHRFGWMAALNHAAGLEFGTGEASLMNSVAVILGIHSGNILLYQQQAELTAGIIRALTEAIDAKDQYTCGHSDRVARIAVRLAREMKCDLPTVNTIYLAGLLHDIGKIGITDDVLRKPGKLTAEEYEHIKSHTVIGHRILRDIKKLDNILPIILHHHEAWNGAGYPMQLAAEKIPLAARIVAVADSYDAMGSDRPYRKGMPGEKIAEILRNGSGVQWDPEVVAAYFRIENELRKIVNDNERDLQLDLRNWPN